jgi:two-component system nitrate/nitrite response regulator NarL
MNETPAMVRIVVADDHPLVRDGLKAHLAATPHLRVVAEADNGRQALELALALAPDLVLADVNMDEINGIELTQRLRQAAPQIKTMILSMHGDPEYVAAAVAAGARGYVLKGAPTQCIIAAIDTVLAGNTYFSTPVAKAEPQVSVADDALTERETEVLALLAQGDSNKRIAQKLGISTRTVETHRLSLRRKLGIATPAGLVKYAMERGLIK